MNKRFVSTALALCLLFGCACARNGEQAENTDDLIIIINNSALITCDPAVGVTFGLDISVSGVENKAVGFIVDETHSYITVNKHDYTLSVGAGVPDNYVFRLTVYSEIDRSKSAYKDFTVRAESKTEEPDNNEKPLGPDAPLVPDLGDGKPVYLANGRIKPPEQYLVDDFSEGIDEEKWYLSTQTWGGLENYNGCRSENVSYTADGILLLKAQGMYSADVPLSGAAVITRQAYGAGSYQVAMKVAPRLGICNAIWTFYYGRGGRDNHEIDIELPGHKTPGGGEIGYDRVLNTNWVAENKSVSSGVITESPANDGAWHLYRFDWHTAPSPRVDYFVDGILTHSETEFVPSIKGLFWIGAWLPNKWCGAPDFEVDYMMVDWFSFTPFNQPASEEFAVPSGYETDLDKYPKLPVPMPRTDYISNGGFDGNARAWTAVGDAGISAGAISLAEGSAAYQTVTAVYSGFKYELSALAKTTGKGRINVYFYDRNGELLSGTQTFDFGSDLFAATGGLITAPEGSDKMIVEMSSVSGLSSVDDISVKLI